MGGLGSTIQGRYRLDRRLGAGGMSTVYQAFDTTLERQVAIKILAEHLAEDQAFITRFRHEALAVARLTHPNIVQVYDTGADGARHFIVMEYVEGKSGADLLKEHGHLSVAEATDIVVQSCAGLDYAHRHGIIHRDMKPGNLLVSEQGTVKLADFGIAKAAEFTRVTQIGSVLGTAAYLSPEQAHGEETGPASDIYSLGVVLYQLLTGKLPREFSSIADLAAKQQEPVEPPSKFNSEVPRALDRAVAVCLANDPRDRYGSAPEMAEAIRLGAGGQTTEATVALGEAHTQRRGAAAGAAMEADTAATRALPARRARKVSRQAPPPQARAATPKKRRRLRRFVAAIAVLVLFGAGVVAAVLATTNSTTRQQITAPIENDVNRQIQSLEDLINKYTKR